MSTYQLELMDHDVKMVCLTSDESIIIEKNGYRIVSSDKEKEKDKDKDKCI
jgi:hypothetical protein